MALASEIIMRLTDPGEVVIDIGANLGHMTSLFAFAVQASGIVHAFEPHPLVFDRLSKNVDRWRLQASYGSVVLYPVALSDEAGVAELSTSVFAINEGSASVKPFSTELSEGAYAVETRRLDDVLGAEQFIGVMKLDVEGHELQVLQGATRLLASHRVRDVIFEEHGTVPTPVTELLEAHGYTVMQVEEHFLGFAVKEARGKPKALDDPSLVATRDPERARARLRVRGSAVYRFGPAARLRVGRR
jgi:FkbM family methyltransferase